MFKENNIYVIAAKDFSGLPNMDTLGLSTNRLDDESFSQNSLSVSNSSLLDNMCALKHNVCLCVCAF